MKVFVWELLMYVEHGVLTEECELDERIEDDPLIPELVSKNVRQLTASPLFPALQRVLLNSIDVLGNPDDQLLVLKFCLSSDVPEVTKMQLDKIQGLGAYVRSQLADFLADANVNYFLLASLPVTVNSAIKLRIAPEFSIENGQKLAEMKQYAILLLMLYKADQGNLQYVKKDFYTALVQNEPTFEFFCRNLFKFLLFSFLQLDSARKLPQNCFLFKYLARMKNMSLENAKYAIDAFYNTLGVEVAWQVLKTMDYQPSYFNYKEYDFPELSGSVLRSDTLDFSEDVLGKLGGHERQIYQLLLSAFQSKFSFAFDFAALEIVYRLSKPYREYVLLQRKSNVYRIYMNNILNASFSPHLLKVAAPLQDYCALLSKLNNLQVIHMALVGYVAQSDVCQELKQTALDLIVQNCAYDSQYRLPYLVFARTSRLPVVLQPELALENLILTISQTFVNVQNKQLLHGLQAALQKEAFSIQLLFKYLGVVDLSIAHKIRVVEYYLQAYEPSRWELLQEMMAYCQGGESQQTDQVCGIIDKDRFEYKQECEPLWKRIIDASSYKRAPIGANGGKQTGLPEIAQEQPEQFLICVLPVLKILEVASHRTTDYDVQRFAHRAIMTLTARLYSYLSEQEKNALGLIKREEEFECGAAALGHGGQDFRDCSGEVSGLSPELEMAVAIIKALRHLRAEWLSQKSAQMLVILSCVAEGLEQKMYEYGGERAKSLTVRP